MDKTEDFEKQKVSEINDKNAFEEKNKGTDDSRKKKRERKKEEKEKEQEEGGRTKKISKKVAKR